MAELACFSSGRGSVGYLEEIRRFPMLSAEDEKLLVRRWRDKKDQAARYRLITSHLRLVARIARSYRRGGVHLDDLIAEGSIGLMQAVDRFDPERGVRLAAYAKLCIRTTIQQYILNSWSLVRRATTTPRKRLFFTLQRMRSLIKAIDGGELTPEQTAEIAGTLGVSVRDVIITDVFVTIRDSSLHKTHLNGGRDLLDFLRDESPNPERVAIESEEESCRTDLLSAAMETLNPLERHILARLRITDDPPTPRDLAAELGIPHEQLRKIYCGALRKLKRILTPKREGSRPRLSRVDA